MDTPGQETDLQFARQSVQQLHGIARELAKERGIKSFCSLLEVALYNVIEFLDDHAQEELAVPQLLGLLNNLDTLCRWPNRPAGTSKSQNVPLRRQYPGLAPSFPNRQAAKKVIRAFASESRLKAQQDRKIILKRLKTFEKKPNPSSGPESVERDTIGAEQDEYSAHIRALYATLAAHCSCPNDEEGGSKYITANIRLKDCCRRGEVVNSVSFRVFFLDHPHHHGHGACQWQDTEICVPRNSRVKFTDNQASSGADGGEIVTMATFCRTITSRSRAQLKLAVRDQALMFHGPVGLSEGYLLSESSVSLGEVLNATQLPPKTRLLLSYHLAKAVWQFYDSGWMRREWTKDTVHFMIERQQVEKSRGIFANEPFLSTHFDDCSASQGEDQGFRVHPLPRILSLGIMLLEIELGIKMESDQRLEGFPDLQDSEPTVNDDYIRASALLKNSELWDERGTFPALKEAIRTCIVPDQLRPFCHNTQDLRDAFKRHVVNPLQVLYKTCWADPDTSSIRPTKLDSLSPPAEKGRHVPTPFVPQPALAPEPCSVARFDQMHSYCYPGASPSAGSLSPPLYHPMPRVAAHFTRRLIVGHSGDVPSPFPDPFPDAAMSTSSSTTSEDWFAELDKLNSIFRIKPKEKDGLYRPVKIAILDTGVKEEYAHRVQDFKDFVDRDDDEWQDRTGHGTSAVDLIQKVYNTGEIYVGRVFDDREATDETPLLMAEAIRHAKDVWEVDVIVMPSGFRFEHRALEDAIDDARHAGILSFAAASNYGNALEIAFPGRLYIHAKLFCLFSTQANVRALSAFNPSASSKARRSFAVLGDDIVLPHLRRPLSGTSFSTMIGAAVAARVLDFSRHPDNRDAIRHVDKLRTVQGMSAVFEQMVQGGVDNGYYCIAPWKILPSGLEGDAEGPAAKRVRQRAYVRETISRALEDMRRA